MTHGSSELADIGARRLEGRALHRGPAADLRAQTLHHALRLVELAPDEDGGAGAGDRGAQRAELARALDDLRAAGIEVRAVGLVQAVGQPAADEVEVARR